MEVMMSFMGTSFMDGGVGVEGFLLLNSLPAALGRDPGLHSLVY